jgi:hypothetical protein
MASHADVYRALVRLYPKDFRRHYAYKTVFFATGLGAIAFLVAGLRTRRTAIGETLVKSA